MLRIKKWPEYRTTSVAVIMLFSGSCFAQVLAPDITQNRSLQLSEEQYEKGFYSMAAQSARQYLDAPADKISTEKSSDIEKAKYYLSLSELKADVKGSDIDAANTLKEINNTAYSQRIDFTLAQYYFQHNELAKAIPFYESAGIDNLSNTEVADEKFELAYCYFNDRQFNKAEPLLQAIKEIKEGKYYNAGNYYYGLLAYNENKYKEALKSFDRVKDVKEYKPVVPYYIAEIYYFMGNRAKAKEQADLVIKGKEKSFYDNELHLLAAQCLFEEQKYSEAKPYFQYYYDHSTKIRKEDLYEMAYCDYRTSEWTKAIEKFKMLSNLHDSLGQTSMYLLGDCYLNTHDKKSARNAFGICADMTYNEGQQEASMIIYSKLSYETGYNDEALRQLKNLLKTFPRTEYRDEANTLISTLLVKTNDYEQALKHLDEVGKRDDNFNAIYQKATYGYGVQQFRKGELKSANKYFTLSSETPVNTDYEDAAYFWRGELCYRLHHYHDAITYSEAFINKKGNKTAIEHLSPLATVQHAYLNMGFASMEAENYTEAQNYFNKAQEIKSKDNYSGSIAAMREADAVFMQKKYAEAIVLYDKLIVTDKTDADYARYQKAILLGLLGKNSEKMAVLQSIINSTPPSGYANYARYELSVTYLEADKFALAVPYLKYLTDTSKDKSFAPKSWMKTGFVYQQLNENSRAIDAYKHVVVDYPASEERMPAMDALKSLYIQSNQPSAYAQMLKDNNLPSAESNSLDSTYYAAAESQFANNKWEEARTAFGSYLEKYPNGIFAIKARYYRAESNYQLQDYKDALPDYEHILWGQVNDFYENSALRAAVISYSDKDYKKAFGYYIKLRNSTLNPQTKEVAYNGLMLSGYFSNMYGAAEKYADTLLEMPGVPDETMNDALYYKAKTLQHFDSSDAAIKAYKQLGANKNGEVAAESRYRIAELLLKQEKLKEAETAANETIRLSAGYDFWIVKSYILLSDVLVKEKDYFNAKATLESIVKHTKIQELKDEATKKLDVVKTLEKQQTKLSEDKN